MHALRKNLERIDALVYRIERGLLLASVFSMTTLVFLQVLQRTFTRQVGKTAQLMNGLLEAVMGPIDADLRTSIEQTWGDVAFYVFALLFCIAAVHAGRSARIEKEGLNTDSVDFSGSLGMGVVLFLVLGASLKAMLWLLPTGVPGAQKYALGMLVWSGLLGASIVTRTRGHILLDALKKKYDDDVMPWISAVGGLFTASVAGLIAYLSLHSAIEKFHEWVDSDFLLERLYDNSPVPMAVVVLALPVCFGLIAIRFLMQGFSDLLWGPPLPEEEGIAAANVDEESLGQEKAAPSPTDEALSAKATPKKRIGTPHVEGGAS